MEKAIDERMDYQIRVGQPSKWKEFASRNHEFLLEMEPLTALARAVFDRDIEGGPLERAIFTTGRLTVDDFWAVFILATNGYGFSARGLLRSMFERVVVGIRRGDKVRLKALEETIQTTRTQYAKFHDQGLDDTAAVFNAALYLLLFDRDFTALKEFFIATDDHWNRQLVGRQMAVMLYEGVQDLSRLFGNEFRTILSRNDVSEERRTALDGVRSRLTTFRSTHADRLKELRNVMAAHRDKDVMAQLRIVDSLHPFEVYETSVEFWAVVRELTDVLTQVISELGAPMNILKQMVRRHPKH